MKNLVKLYKSISPDRIAEGRLWYVKANLFCTEVATRYGLSTMRVAGILSALSPGTNYEQNKKDTVGLIQLLQGKIHAYRFTTYGSNVDKAKAIFNDKGKQFIGYFSPKTGPKTYNFYLNIINPFTGVGVTVDRHAYRIATGLEYKHLTPKQYEVVVDHYKKSAKSLGILPCELQAVLWIDYRIKQDIQFAEFNDNLF